MLFAIMYCADILTFLLLHYGLEKFVSFLIVFAGDTFVTLISHPLLHKSTMRYGILIIS